MNVPSFVVVTIAYFLRFGIFLPTVDAMWWYSCMLDETPIRDSNMYCRMIPNLNRDQRQICKKKTEHIKMIGKGVKEGITECQHQFRNRRWNCSVFVNDTTLFGMSLIKGGTREVALVQSLMAATATHALVRMCWRGYPNCGCILSSEESKVTSGVKGTRENVSVNHRFKWSGCEEALKVSSRFVRKFVNNVDLGRTDGRAQFNLHNTKVGINVLRKGIKKVCKCHGLSGSCSTRTCWDTFGTTRQLGDKLKDKYDAAVEITFTPRGRILPIQKHHKKPSKQDLIYYQPSPNFCVPDIKKGSTGTHERLCQEDSNSEDSCDILCCKQKYQVMKVKYIHSCNCTFTWCCQVHCNQCNATRTEFRCVG